MNALDRLGELSLMELAVLEGWAEGLSTSVIATDLGVSPNTVRTYAMHIRLKLGVHSKAAAVGIWERHR